jgi:ribosomal protein S12 methylthiotransferase
MYGLLDQADCSFVDDPAGADVIVVNTCSFIQPATEESVDTVLEMARYKGSGQCKKLVVTGCMVQRYGRTLEEELPEVDHFLGTGEYHRIADVLEGRGETLERSVLSTPTYMHDETVPRVHSWSKCSAYLKISEGCDHKCTFCIIPQLRGRLRSRTVPSLVSEARSLANTGVVELNLISQDSTAYGRDLGDGTGLARLLDQLSEVEQIRWLRLHYAYPHGLPDGLLEHLSSNPRVCRYLDIPLQHASGTVLKAMRRGVTRAGQERILERVRGHVPDIAIRTTFIVGFPGESDGDFMELYDFVEQQRFDHVGVFTYYPEDSTPGAELPNQVEESVKQERQSALMSLQRGISRSNLGALVDTIQLVLVEGVSKESALLLRGRMETQAPDVDGQVYITNPSSELRVGDFVNVHIEQVSDYDLAGEAVGPS